MYTGIPINWLLTEAIRLRRISYQFGNGPSESYGVNLPQHNNSNKAKRQTTARELEENIGGS